MSWKTIKDVPWHITTLNKNDETRNKSRCIHFIHLEYKKGNCAIKGHRCTGSSHCSEYREKKIQKANAQLSAVKTIKKTPFTGIKKINMDDILLREKFSHKPSQQKIDQLLAYYHKHGVLDKPILVSSSDNKYILEDKYLRYYVAKELGLKQIDAQYGLFCNELEEALRTVGTKVLHQGTNGFTGNGIGIVSKVSLDRLYVVFESGEEISFCFPDCIKFFSLI